MVAVSNQSCSTTISTTIETMPARIEIRCSRENAAPLGHVVRSVTPTATTRSPRNRSSTLGSGRRGGPASGRPVARSKLPWWQGQ